MYTIPDFGPSDILTSAVENRRRVKTSSRTSIDDASIEGKAQSIAQIVNIPDGESVCFNIYTTGETLLALASCDGLDITVYSEYGAGLLSDNGSSKNMRIGSNLFYDVFYTYLVNPTLNSDAILNASRGAFNPSVTFDHGAECAIVISNNSGSDYVGSFAAIFDVFTPPDSLFWLQSDTYLTATTEMSNYG